MTMSDNGKDTEQRLPFGAAFEHSVRAEAGGGVLNRYGASGQFQLAPGETTEIPVSGQELASILGGAQVVSVRGEEAVQPPMIPPHLLNVGLVEQGGADSLSAGVAGWQPAPPPAAGDGAGVTHWVSVPPDPAYQAAATPTLPDSDCAPACPTSTLADLAAVLGRHPQGQTVLEQIAQVCGATPGNVEILREIESYLGKPPWEQPAHLLGGGAVVGTGNVSGPASSVDDNLAAFDGTTGKLIDDSGIAKDTVMTTARPQLLTPDPADVLGMAQAGGPPQVVAISDVNAILDHNIQTNLAVGDVHTQYAKDSGTPGSTGFVPVYTADRQIAPSGVGIPDGAGGQNLEVPGLISAPTALVGTEQASSPHATAAGQGTFYVRNTAPSKPAFEGDTGVDQLLLLAGDIGVSVQAWDADLDAIAALGSTGYAVRTAANTWAQRAFTASSEITITNPSGIAGDTLLNITANGITDLMLRDSGACSVIGRSANSAGDPADISAGANNTVLKRASNALSFGAVELDKDVTGTLPIANGGTNGTTAAAAATNLGLGTGDSPQFAAVNVGHASDTTITRVSAGNLAVEGNTIYRAGGTDVALADGGTGASDAATARTNLDVDKKVIYAQKAPGDVAINSTTFTVPLITKSISLAAGDVLDFDAQFLVLNNSGAARTLVFRINVGSFNIDITDGATFANHASNRGIVTLRGSACIISTSLAWIALEVRRQGPAASGTDNNLVLAQSRADWATTASNFTGSQTCEIHCIGNNATATQTATVINATIYKRQAV